MDPEAAQNRMARILLLISSFIRETITPVEQAELDRWAEESDEHIYLFETLTEPANAEGLQQIVDASKNFTFTINFLYEDQEINALIIVLHKNRYEVWMSGVHQFTVSSQLMDIDELQWYLIDKNKYVPYIEEIGRAIENYLM